MLNIVLIFLGFLIAVALARIIIPRILIISLRKRLFDTPDARKVHKKPVSRLGGVSFFPAVLFTVTFLIGVCDMTGWVPLVNVSRYWAQALLLCSGLTLLFIVGIADDLIGVRYRQKFLVQLVAAAMFPLAGLYINDFYGLLGIHYVSSFIGVPLTLLSMTRDTEFGVVEMGASACGELALLASVAEPNYGILTNIGLAHLEGFGGPEGVRRGKGELFDFLAANGGHAFVPADDEILTGMAAERDSLAAEYYSASLADGIENHLEGSYNRFNIAAAVAVGHYFDVPDERIRHAIASYVPDNNRSQRIGTSRNTLVADCYNANPSSMRASVGNFLAEPLEERQRRVLILGDMLELGDWSEREHAAIIEMAAQDPEAELLLVGPEFAKAYDGLAEKPANVTLCPTRDDLISLLKVSPVEHSLVLVKGSHGMGLEQALEAL